MEIHETNTYSAYIDAQSIENQDDEYCGSFVVDLRRFEWDPYTGDHIEWHRLYLNNGTLWEIHWSTFEDNKLFVKENDSVEITRDNKNQYIMEASTRDGDKRKITFSKCGYSKDTFRATFH